MKTEINLHPIQAHIIKYLAFNIQARFTDLNVQKLPNDHFNFHIKRLLREEIVIKNDEDLYELTLKGKQVLGRIDIINLEIEKTPKVTALLLPIQKEKNTFKYLVQKRLKQPYFGYVGSITGKAKFGESIFEAGLRELKEETGLTGDLTFVGTKHKLYYKKEEVIADAYFFMFKVTSITGTLLQKSEEGENFWITKKDINRKDINWFPDFQDTFDMLRKSVPQNFHEIKVSDKGF